jgi:hypothetical protein
MFKTEPSATAQLPPDVLTNYHLAGFRGFLNTRSGINPITIQITVDGDCDVS